MAWRVEAPLLFGFKISGSFGDLMLDKVYDDGKVDVMHQKLYEVPHLLRNIARRRSLHDRRLHPSLPPLHGARCCVQVDCGGAAGAQSSLHWQSIP